MDKLIYADHSATTPVRKEVLEKMLPYFNKYYGNPSSSYLLANKSKSAISKAREEIAKAIGIENEEEIYFTSGGSEADNMIIKGIARANKNRGKHIITTKIEHPAVLKSCKNLEKEGFEITYLGVDKDGIINLKELENSIKDDTILVSVMFANNEIGTIEPIEEIGKICKFKGVYFHTDAVQAIGNLNINVKAMNIDALSMSAHKFYGPKGIGAAYIKSKIEFDSIINGGGQEFSKRAGTENVPAIVGMGEAIKLASLNIHSNESKLIDLRETFIKLISEKLDGIKINGHRNNRLPGNVNISIPECDSRYMLLNLNISGICASAGSACSTLKTSPSHVLKAIGLEDRYLSSSLRFTFGEENTKEEIEYIADKIAEIRNKIVSP